MNRAETLDAAKACVCQNREQEYGSPEDNFALIAALWEAFLTWSDCLDMSVFGECKVDMKPKDVACMMILLKIARIKSGHGKDDNWIDIAGYAACGAELESLEEEIEDE